MLLYALCFGCLWLAHVFDEEAYLWTLSLGQILLVSIDPDCFKCLLLYYLMYFFSSSCLIIHSSLIEVCVCVCVSWIYHSFIHYLFIFIYIYSINVQTWFIFFRTEEQSSELSQHLVFLCGHKYSWWAHKQGAWIYPSPTTDLFGRMLLLH